MLPNCDVLDTLHAEHRSLAILRFMVRYGGIANLPLLNDVLDIFGLVATAETVRADLRSLKDKGLIEVNEADVWPTRLTEKGQEAAEGRLTVEGVRCPLPACPY
jgi:hypothetical protein